MTESMIVALIGVSGTLLVTLINIIFNSVKDNKRHNDANTAATRLCLLFVLQKFGEELDKKEFITRLELNQFEAMYKTYKDLRGDGFADKINEEVHKKPITYT